MELFVSIINLFEAIASSKDYVFFFTHYNYIYLIYYTTSNDKNVIPSQYNKSMRETMVKNPDSWKSLIVFLSGF